MKRLLPTSSYRHPRLILTFLALVPSAGFLIRNPWKRELVFVSNTRRLIWTPVRLTGDVFLIAHSHTSSGLKPMFCFCSGRFGIQTTDRMLNGSMRCKQNNVDITAGILTGTHVHVWYMSGYLTRPDNSF